MNRPGRSAARAAATVVAALLLAGCTARLSSSDDTPRRLTGRVLEADGSPARNVRVKAGELTGRYETGDEVRGDDAVSTDEDGRYDVRLASGGYSTGLEVSTSDGRRLVLRVEADDRRVRLPDLRLWQPRPVAQARPDGTVRLTWAPAPYRSVVYAVHGVTERGRERTLAAPMRSIDIFPLADGTGPLTLVADATESDGGKRPYTVTLTAPAPKLRDSSAVRPVAPVSCTGWDETGRSRALPQCAISRTNFSTRPGDPSFVTVRLPRPLPISAVALTGCNTFCDLYTSDNGRHWREIAAFDDSLSSTDKPRLIRPASPLRTSWVAVATPFGPGFDGDTAATFARDKQPMPFAKLVIYSGVPLREPPERPEYHPRQRLGYGAEPPGGRPDGDLTERVVARGKPLPKTAVPATLLVVMLGMLVVFAVQGRRGGGEPK